MPWYCQFEQTPGQATRTQLCPDGESGCATGGAITFTFDASRFCDSSPCLVRLSAHARALASVAILIVSR